MPIYSYKAKKDNGQIITGRLLAFGNTDANKRLNRKRLEPIYLNDISERWDTSFYLRLRQVKNRDLVIFSREFSLLIASNVGVVESLATILDQTENLKLKNIISWVAYDVDAGTLLSDSLAKHGSGVFSSFYINVVKAGETSGKLEEVLLYLADELEKDYDLLSRFKSAMIYPAFVVSGLVAVGFVMMYYVMPELTNIIQETGAALPWSTLLVISVVSFFRDYFWLILILLIGAIVGFQLLIRTPWGRKKFDIFKISFPIVGPLFKLLYLIRFCRAFSTLLYGGVTMTKSLEVSSDVVRNQVYKDIINEALQEVSEGHSVSQAFAASKYVPKMVPQMMFIGERSGKLDEVLEKISVFYGRELNAKTTNLNAILEPVIIIVMGIGVAIMVSAIILPMYSVATSF